MQLTIKQTKAFDYLQDRQTEELLFGGAAGGGKSILGCAWLIYSSLTMEKSRWVMGRASLKTLRETTLQSFFKVCEMQGLKSGVHYILTSAQDKSDPNAIIFPQTKSVILMKDLFAYPSDPEFDDLGSLEVTGGFIDEGAQITEKAKQILKSRMRHNITKYNTVPKLLITSNPSKNWMYRDFYQPYKNGTLPKNRKFVQSLISDNTEVDPTYLKTLQELQGVARERLLLGNWDYDNSPNKLIIDEAIAALFGLNIVDKGDYYLTADIARFGSDRAIICVWEGWAVVDYLIFEISSTTEIQAAINTMRVKYNIPADRCVADEDGVGGGVVDSCQIRGFVNNSSAIINPNDLEKENYQNLQSQMGYHLAKKVNAREVVFRCDLDSSEREIIQQDLEQLQTYKIDIDGKLRIKPKAEIKAEIGRSPDWRDVLLMRGYFDYVGESWAKIWG